MGSDKIIIVKFLVLPDRGLNLRSKEFETITGTIIQPRWFTKIVTVFSGVRVTRSLVLCVCFADRC